MSFLAPKYVAPPPPAPVAAADTQTQADKAAEDVKARARKAGSGRQSTILTSPLGTAQPQQAVNIKTLLGQ